MKSLFSIPILMVATLLWSPPVAAFEKFELIVAGGEAVDLEGQLKRASVLSGLAGKADVPDRDVLAAATADYTGLVDQLYGRGYYSAVVSITLNGREAAGIDPFAQPGPIDVVRIDVDPGQVFTFGKVSLSPLAPGTVFPADFSTGAPALASVVRAAVSAALADWRSAGYPKAQVVLQDVTADHARNVLLVDVVLDPGRSATLGKATVTGRSKVRPARVAAIAGLPEGEEYSPDVVDKAAERLRRTGTFQSVRIIEDDAVAADGALGLELNVVDRKPRRIGGGVEFSNFDGLSVIGYWLHRNLFGGAERFRADAGISQIGGSGSGLDYKLSARLEKPAVLGPDTLFFAEGALEYADEPDFLIRKIELGSGFTREINERLSASVAGGLSYSEVQDRFLVPATWRKLQLVKLPTLLTYDIRDDVLNARSGLYLSAGYAPFFETTAGQFGQHLTFDGRGYLALDQDARAVAAARLQAGLLLGPQATDAPPEYLFYSGGGGTVRGHPYQSLGADYGGLTLGGRAFAAVSGEIRYAVTDTIGLVGLADAGFVGPDKFNSGNWHAGAGIGLRYKTPVGPIRLDVAAPVAGTTGQGIQIYIGIGQAF